MTPEQFKSWLETMKDMGQFQRDIDAAEALDVRPQTIVDYKRRGGNRQLALACAAIYHNIEPWTK